MRQLAHTSLLSISNGSSPGSQHLSREPSPFDQGDFADIATSEFYVSPSPEPAAHRRSGSMSRSLSPHPEGYPQAVSSPNIREFKRAGSSPLTKPQSPPALIIPHQVERSPSLPPILTTAADSAGNYRGGVRAPVQNSLGNSGGLLPPANPALEHLTGMAGISPVGPTTDGPMIYIQPSTPISGLKDGRGVFDAAIRRAGGQGAQQAQGQNQGQGGQQQDNFFVTQPASHPLARNSSSDHYSQSVQANHLPNNNASMQFARNHAWGQQGDSPWGELRPSGQMRPRAKSDSYMVAPANDVLDRQMLLAMSGGAQQAMQPGDDLRSTIDHWRSAMIGNRNPAEEAPSATLDPRTLPGNQDTAQNFSQQNVYSQQLPSLNTYASQSGVFKYEPGQFSPTSLAFYQQLGINPATASQLAGTSSAPFSQSSFQNIPQNAWPQTVSPAAQSFLAVEQPGLGHRRRSFAEGSNHPATGAGTPGYGMGFATQPQAGGFGRIHVPSPGMGHRRAVQSEDFGRGTGWGIAGAGSTSAVSRIQKKAEAFFAVPTF